MSNPQTTTEVVNLHDTLTNCTDFTPPISPPPFVERRLQSVVDIVHLLQAEQCAVVTKVPVRSHPMRDRARSYGSGTSNCHANNYSGGGEGLRGLELKDKHCAFAPTPLKFHKMRAHHPSPSAPMLIGRTGS